MNLLLSAKPDQNLELLWFYRWRESSFNQSESSICQTDRELVRFGWAVLHKALTPKETFSYCEIFVRGAPTGELRSLL